MGVLIGKVVYGVHSTWLCALMHDSVLSHMALCSHIWLCALTHGSNISPPPTHTQSLHSITKHTEIIQLHKNMCVRNGCVL